jgi:hypothetical protein
MAELDLGYQLRWADYSGFVEGRARILARGSKRARLPRQYVETFRTKVEAEAAQERLRATGGDGLVSSVVSVVLKPPKPSPAPLDNWPLMQKRLTP